MCVRNRRQHFAALIGSPVNPYYTYLESFEDAVRTFKFREEREQAKVFQPLVTLTPTYAVREKSEEYETES